MDLSINIIDFLNQANSQKNYIESLIEYLNKREQKFTEEEHEAAPKLLFNRSPEIRYNFIKFIGKVKDAALAGSLSNIINDDKEKYYIQLEAISTLTKLSNGDENLKAILKKAVIKLSTYKWQEKILAKNVLAKNAFEQFIDSIKNVLESKFNIKVNSFETKQTNKYYLKDNITVTSRISNDIYGSMILNLNKTTAINFIEKLYEGGWINYPKTEFNDYVIFYDLYSAISFFYEDISFNFQKKNNIFLDFTHASYFNRSNIILSEKEDDAYIINASTEIGNINFGLIRVSEQSLTFDINEIMENLKIFIENNKIVIICKAVKFYIECSLINDDNFNIIDNRLILNKISFKKVLQNFNILSNEIKIDRRLNTQFDNKVRFLGYLCDDINIYSQNFIFHKLDQINPELREKVFSQMTTYKYILKLHNEMAQKIIPKMNYNELISIIINANNSIKNKILMNCSDKMKTTLRNSMSQNYTAHPASVFEAKYKMGRLIKSFVENESEESKNIARWLAEIEDNF
ncbi:MAG TPA: FliG C-terminal domain-containing protein [bacterium]|nr:FliG C-terminal domain-containing protein [bacterium]